MKNANAIGWVIIIIKLINYKGRGGQKPGYIHEIGSHGLSYVSELLT